MPHAGIGVYLLGGSKCRTGGPPYLITMQYPQNTVIKTNDLYFKPGNRSSWARRSKSCAGGRNGHHALPAKAIGVNRLGGCKP